MYKGISYSLQTAMIIILASAAGVSLYHRRSPWIQDNSITADSMQITCVTFSPAGNEFLTAGFDGTVKIWKSDTYECVKTLSANAGSIGCACFSPDGQHLAAAGEDGVVRIWDIKKGVVASKLKGHQGTVQSVAYSMDGRKVATTGMDDSLRIWDSTSGTLVKLLEEQFGILGAQFSENGTSVIAFSVDKHVRILDLETGGVKFTLAPGDEAYLHGWNWVFASFEEDEKSVVTVDNSDRVVYWKIADGEFRAYKELNGKDQPIAIKLINGTCLVTGNSEKHIIICKDGGTVWGILGTISPDRKKRIYCRGDQAVVLRNQHPQFPLGILYLPEGWFLIILVGIQIWRLCRPSVKLVCHSPSHG